jgi:hypothetical protein
MNDSIQRLSTLHHKAEEEATKQTRANDSINIMDNKIAELDRSLKAMHTAILANMDKIADDVRSVIVYPVSRLTLPGTGNPPWFGYWT